MRIISILWDKLFQIDLNHGRLFVICNIFNWYRFVIFLNFLQNILNLAHSRHRNKIITMHSNQLNSSIHSRFANTKKPPQNSMFTGKFQIYSPSFDAYTKRTESPLALNWNSQRHDPWQVLPGWTISCTAYSSRRMWCVGPCYLILQSRKKQKSVYCDVYMKTYQLAVSLKSLGIVCATAVQGMCQSPHESHK